FAPHIPQKQKLNIIDLSSPNNSIFAALFFNAFIIPLLMPIALRGVKFKPSAATQLLRRNMLIYGVGGVVLPFIAIKAIDLILVHILA
ncbi:potassium-transporting ATPase subunit B, partial [Acinetobacter ursingii]